MRIFCGEVFFVLLGGWGGDVLFDSLSLGKELPHLTGQFTLGYFSTLNDFSGI